MNSAAWFDVRFVADSLRAAVGHAAVPDLHLFSYLGCLLSLCEGHASALWEYEFAVTPTGFPFSRALAEEIAEAKILGHLELLDNRLSITPAGKTEVSELLQLESNMIRSRYLSTAISSALAIPPGLIRLALGGADLLPAAEITHSEDLLTRPALGNLYEDFTEISSHLEGSKPLVLPAVAWLSLQVEDAVRR